MSISLPDFKTLFPQRNILQEWEERPQKYEVEAICELPQIKIDLAPLQKFYTEFKQREKSSYEDNVVDSICGIEEGYSDRYYQGILTHATEAAIEMQQQTDKARGLFWKEHVKTLSKKARIESLKYLNEDYDPLLDERNYTRLDPGAQNTYLEIMLKQFQGRPTRIRFGKLRQNEGVNPHIDVFPKYASRVHIPLWTNSQALSFALRKGKTSSYHLEAGKAYMLNGGITHWAHNFGPSDRIHLIISMDGMEDYYARC